MHRTSLLLRTAVSCFALALFACSSPKTVSAPAGCQSSKDCSSDPHGPVCNVTTHACVVCAADADCGSGKHCDVAHDQCVACLGSTECGAGQVCESNVCVPGCSSQHPLCPAGSVCDLQDGACVQCVADTDCPAGSTTTRCDVSQHRCVGCLGDADCAIGSVCRRDSCVAGCNANQPCVSGVCNLTDGACVACISDGDCKSDAAPRCDVHRNACVACLPGSDNCPAGKYCSPDTETCAPGCKADADCPLGQMCTNHACAAGCADNSRCPFGQACCGGQCSLLNTTQNCGACGKSCSAGQGCCNQSCTPLDTTSNCGACGQVCTIANGAPSCGTGACAIGQCDPGFADCNSDPKDGCEVRTDVDVNNCGACGRKCAPPNAVGECVAGTCQVAACNNGYGNCDGSNANGCETALASDPNNCGTCGHQCLFLHANATCSSATCQMSTCRAGWADCNNDPTDGCETNLATLASCGSCGKVCTVANGTPSCTTGSCAIASCNANFADCNSDPTDGCEANLLNDPNHCGSCGVACPNGELCNAGVCGLYPRYAYLLDSGDGSIETFGIDGHTGRWYLQGQLTPGGNLVAAAIDPSGKYLVAVDSSGGKLDVFGIDPKTGLLQSVGSSVAAGTSPESIALYAGSNATFIYVANYGSNNISAYSLNGSGLLKPAGNPVGVGNGPMSIAVDQKGGHLYVANATSNNLYAFSIDASTGNLTQVGSPVANAGTPESIAIERLGRWLYVANYGAGTVTTYAIGKTGALTAIGSPVASDKGTISLAIDPGGAHLYAANYGASDLTVFSIDPTSGAITAGSSPIATGQNPQSVSIDPSGGWLFTADSGARSAEIFSLNASTGTPTPLMLAAGHETPMAVAVQSGNVPLLETPKYLYVSNWDNNSITTYTINANTGAISQLGSPIGSNWSEPTSLAIDPTGHFAYTADSNSGVVSVYTIAAASGAISFTGGNGWEQPYTSSLFIDPTDRYLFVAPHYYCSWGSGPVVFHIDPSSGNLSNGSFNNPGPGNTSDTIIDPTGRFYYDVTDSCWNQIEMWRIDAATGTPTWQGTVGGLSGIQNASWHVTAIDPFGQYLYVSDWSAQAIHIYAIQPDGTLKPAGNAGAGSSPWDLAMTPDGRHLYVANYYDGTIGVYAADPASGALTAVGRAVNSNLSGGGPGTLTVDPTGQFLYVGQWGGNASNEVQPFQINSSSGALTPVGGPVSTPVRASSMQVLGVLQ